MQSQESGKLNSSGLPESRQKIISDFSIRDLTIKQIKEGSFVDDLFLVNGRKTGTIRIVGYIKEVTQMNRFQSLSICDLSEVFIVRVWDDVLKENIPEVGSWVDIIGTVRINKTNKDVDVVSMNAVVMRKITDFNVFLFHIAKCVEGHIYSKNSSFSKIEKEADTDEDLNEIQKEVLNVYKREKDETDGVSNKKIFEKLGEKYEKNDLEKTINWLHIEGKIFGAVDEFHHRWCP